MGSETSQRFHGWVGVLLVFLLLFFNLKGSNKVTLGARDVRLLSTFQSDQRENFFLFFFFGPPLPSSAKAMSHHHVTKIVHSGNIRRETDCDGQRTCFIDPFASIKVRTTSLIKILQGTAYCQAMEQTNSRLFSYRLPR